MDNWYSTKINKPSGPGIFYGIKDGKIKAYQFIGHNWYDPDSDMSIAPPDYWCHIPPAPDPPKEDYGFENWWMSQEIIDLGKPQEYIYIKNLGSVQRSLAKDIWIEAIETYKDNTNNHETQD